MAALEIEFNDERPSLRSLLDDSDDDTVVGENENLEQELDPEAELENFRLRWRAEIHEQGASSRDASIEPSMIIPPTISKQESSTYEMARVRFLQGVECEKMGDMFEAVKHYHHAVRLVPDIEQRLYSEKQGISHSSSGLALMSLTADEDDEIEQCNQLSEGAHTASGDHPVHLGDIVKLYANGPYCQPVAQQIRGPKHIGNLNQDIWLCILRWLVGAHTVDARQLEVVSRVSCGLYSLCRTPAIWRMTAAALWRQNELMAMCERQGSLDYRMVVLTQPHLWHDGLYIGKCTYVRHGEASFQDQFYKPWFLVTYYRYFRAWANGACMMIVSTSPPADVVPLIRTCDPVNLRQKLNTEATLFYGNYMYLDADGLIRCEMQKSELKDRTEERRRLVTLRSQARRSNKRVPYSIETLAIYTAMIDLRIESPRRRLAYGRHYSTVLLWQSYITRAHYLDSTCTVDTVIDHKDHSAFPAMIFSRVKSYSQVCDPRPV